MRKFLKKFYLFAVYFFLYSPLALLIILSFNDSAFSSAFSSFTFKWYEKLFNNEMLMGAALNSLLVAVSSATLATVTGSLAAVSFFRFRFFGKKFITALLYIILMSPDIVMGISLLILFSAIRMPLGYGSLLIAHTTFSLPFVMLVLFTRLADFDKSIIEAAKDLGANELQTFYHIILPCIAPAAVSAWLLSFTISMDDSIVSFFVTGPRFEVLPLKIYSMVHLGVTPEINALSAIMFLFCIVLVIIAQSLVIGKKK